MKKITSILLILVLITSQFSFVFAYDDEEYYVQVGAFESKYNAEKHTKYMISIGYEAVTIKVYDLYKVFLGPYDTEERAREIAADYKSVGGSGFFMSSSNMFYQPPVTQETEEEIEDTVEEVEETEDTVEDTVEETEDTVEETEDTVEEENATEEVEESVDEEVTENESTEDELEVVVKDKDQEKEEKSDYKLFTIILIVMLWLIFIVILVVFRLNQNRNSMN